MPFLVTRDISESDVTYWSTRVRSLETLVCELLAKNERMRITQEATFQESQVMNLFIDPFGYS